VGRSEMEEIIAGLDTKAAKIRALNEAGADTSAISEFLGIRYQHTYNVLLRAKRLGRSEPLPAEAPVIALEVQPGGTVILPAGLLGTLGLQEGSQLFCRHTPDGLLLLPRDKAIAELQRLALERMPEHASLLVALLEGRSTGSLMESD
jgi:antitoxin component of MazEF toxin-antitoxin module